MNAAMHFFWALFLGWAGYRGVRSALRSWKHDEAMRADAADLIEKYPNATTGRGYVPWGPSLAGSIVAAVFEAMLALVMAAVVSLHVYQLFEPDADPLAVMPPHVVLVILVVASVPIMAMVISTSWKLWRGHPRFPREPMPWAILLLLLVLNACLVLTVAFATYALIVSLR